MACGSCGGRKNAGVQSAVRTATLKRRAAEAASQTYHRVLLSDGRDSNRNFTSLLAAETYARRVGGKVVPG